jgi:hypothetical protein
VFNKEMREFWPDGHDCGSYSVDMPKGYVKVGSKRKQRVLKVVITIKGLSEP